MDEGIELDWANAMVETSHVNLVTSLGSEQKIETAEIECASNTSSSNKICK